MIPVHAALAARGTFARSLGLLKELKVSLQKPMLGIELTTHLDY
jgi:hypothetical protein